MGTAIAETGTMTMAALLSTITEVFTAATGWMASVAEIVVANQEHTGQPLIVHTGSAGGDCLHEILTGIIADRLRDDAGGGDGGWSF